MDVTIINPQLSYLDFRCKDTAKILFHQTLSRKNIEKSSFFLKILCLLDFYFPVVVGVIENGRIVALSHCRIVAFFSCTCANYIWKGRMVLYIIYYISILYFHIYYKSRARRRGCATVRQCDNATLFSTRRKGLPRQRNPLSTRTSPRISAKPSQQLPPRKKCHLTPFFGQRRRQKKSPFLPKNDPTRYKTHPHP